MACLAVLLLSVPPLVKNISPGFAFNNFATVFWLIQSPALIPIRITEDGLPNFSLYGNMASSTLSSAVVAALSK
jgi:hypothetical protein